jgi:hypothetical protein
MNAHGLEVRSRLVTVSTIVAPPNFDKRRDLDAPRKIERSSS